MKQIIIVTNRFPFGKDETFLETEIPFFKKVSAKVTIFSQNTEETKRNTPNSIEVFFASKKKFKFKSYYFKFVFVLIHEIIRNINSLYKLKVLIIHFKETLQLLDEIKDKIAHLLSKEDVVVYCYWLDKSVLAALLLAKEFTNVRVISRGHGGDLYYERHPKNYLPFRKFIFKNIEQVFCISKHGQDYLNKRHPLSLSKISLSYLGTTNSLEIKNIQKNSFKFVSCSHINPIKRLDLLIDSLSELTFECHWTHLGYGFGFNEKPIIEQAKEQLDKHKFVQYEFKGQVPNEKIIDLYRKLNFSLFINVSSTEGLPVSIMEAMSCGIPCIGTDVGGVSEIIKDGFNGFLLNSNATKKDVVEALIKFRNLSENDKNIMSKNARSTWHEKFNARINYTNFTNRLSQL